MKVALSRFWSEQDGFIVSAELLLIATILVIGLVAGLSAVRDSVVTELADLAQAIANLNQSFSIGATVGHCGFTGGSTFVDLQDFCDLGVGVSASSRPSASWSAPSRPWLVAIRSPARTETSLQCRST